jgi:hypothetical protein
LFNSRSARRVRRVSNTESLDLAAEIGGWLGCCFLDKGFKSCSIGRLGLDGRLGDPGGGEGGGGAIIRRSLLSMGRYEARGSLVS